MELLDLLVFHKHLKGSYCLPITSNAVESCRVHSPTKLELNSFISQYTNPPPKCNNGLTLQVNPLIFLE